MIIDGKKIASEISNELKNEITFLKSKNIVPTLVIIQIGDVHASNVYIKNKMGLSQLLGAKTSLVKLPQETTTEQMVDLINKYNGDNQINGILVQMPLPKHIDETKIIESISSNKDVDCFKLDNVGRL
jgi:methylenetetrahydrofolate dehydrogenase (NADP+)/methenyltetrahydrofolate cyclohydrolase